jgi:nitrite reductase/ring-hydroxylating ferredoxin subunit/uncharacterized membrane protein
MRGLTAAAERAVTAIEGQRRLDGPSYRLEHGLALALNLLRGARTPVANLLHGPWLGHPVHPVLTDLPVGAWSTTLALDAASVLCPGAQGPRAAARTAVGLGVVGGLGAAVTGLADWQYTDGEERRVGLVHGLANLTAIGLCARSWQLRRSGRHGRARLFSTAGYAIAMSSAYLGGVLVYRHRVGVDHADRDLRPRTFVPVLPETELPEGTPRLVEADGMEVVLVRHDGRIRALGNRCAHRGGPLAEGVVHGTSLACPWHGSRFDLADGTARTGPATAPQPHFETRVRDGWIEVRCRPRVTTAAPGAIVAREQAKTDARH